MMTDRGVTHARRRRLAHRTRQLRTLSRLLYRIEHYTSLSWIALAIPGAFVCLVVVIALLGYPEHWVAGFELGVSALTLIMVFTIQHTQTREQAATQRKLDELLRAMPGAAESLMMLEEAPETFIHDVEEGQRARRSELVDGDGGDGAS